MVEHLEWEGLSVARKSLIPGEGFFRVDRDEPPVEPDRFGGAAVIAVADADADGLTAAALVHAVHGELTLVPTEPHQLDRTLVELADTVPHGVAIYLLDLCPDGLDRIESALERIVDEAEFVRWYDHHEWDDGLEAAVRDTGVDLHIGDSDEVATADVALDALGGDLDERWVDLVAVVRDHDLWIRDDPRSDDVADLAYWSDPEEFIETVEAHGADLPEETMAFLEDRRVEKQALIDAAVNRAEYRDIEGVTVGITYGRCSQNEVAEAMRQGGADAAVVIKPSGGISLRGTDAFQRAHEVAHRLGGGGHPKAAGCKPPIFDDMLDFAHHWTTHGSTARHLVIEAVRAVLADEDQST